MEAARSVLRVYSQRKRNRVQRYSPRREGEAETLRRLRARHELVQPPSRPWPCMPGLFTAALLAYAAFTVSKHMFCWQGFRAIQCHVCEGCQYMRMACRARWRPACRARRGTRRAAAPATRGRASPWARAARGTRHQARASAAAGAWRIATHCAIARGTRSTSSSRASTTSAPGPAPSSPALVLGCSALRRRTMATGRFRD